MTANQFSRRTFLGSTAAGAGLLLGGSSLITACSGSSEPPAAAPLSSVNFQLSWFDSVQFGGSYIADERGYYERYGLDVTLTPGGFDAPVDPPVIAGQAIMGISAADYAGRSVNEGAPFKIVGVAMQRNPFVIASLPDNPVNVPGDLVGKTLGMGLINQPVLDALATFNGFDVGDVEIDPSVAYDPAPLVNGDVDALLCWLTDLPVAMTVAGVPNTTMLMADFGFSAHSQTYIVTEDTLANNRDTVLGLLKGEILGWQEYKSDTDAAAQLTVDRFPDLALDLETQKLQASEQLKIMFSDDTDANGFLWFTDESVQDNVATLAQLGVNVTPDLWDRSLLEEIFADGPVLA